MRRVRRRLSTRPFPLDAPSPAFEVVEGRGPSASLPPPPVLLTAEHASQELPEGWAWSEEDRQWFVGRHWSYDPGTADLARELSDDLGALALLSRVSRLFADVNRPVSGSDTLFRAEGDGRAVELNKVFQTAHAEEERRARLLLGYMPYHAALAALAAGVGGAGGSPPRAVLSLHSFTPEYEGERREVEVGVLTRLPQGSGSLADRFVGALRGAGFDTRYNEPWSAEGGFMHAAEQAASVAGDACEPVMFEFRQDLSVQPAFRAEVRAAVVSALRAHGLCNDGVF